MGVLVRLGVRLFTRFIYARFGKRVGRFVSGGTMLALGLLVMLIGIAGQSGGSLLIGLLCAGVGVVFLVLGFRTPALASPAAAQPYQQAYPQAQPYQQPYPQQQPYQQPYGQAAQPYPQQMNGQQPQNPYAQGPYAPQNPYAQGQYPPQQYGQQPYAPQANPQQPQSYPQQPQQW